MTRREEVERLVMERIDERAKQYIRDLPGSLVDDGHTIDPIDEELYETIYRDGLKDGIEWSIPDRYTPREEVTEGWYVARGITATAREPIEVMRLKRDGRLHVVIMGSEPEYELAEWTDFLPVPAWLVEGIGDN